MSVVNILIRILICSLAVPHLPDMLIGCPSFTILLMMNSGNAKLLAYLYIWPLVSELS